MRVGVIDGWRVVYLLSLILRSYVILQETLQRGARACRGRTCSSRRSSSRRTPSRLSSSRRSSATSSAGAFAFSRGRAHPPLGATDAKERANHASSRAVGSRGSLGRLTWRKAARYDAIGVARGKLQSHRARIDLPLRRPRRGLRRRFRSRERCGERMGRGRGCGGALC